MKKAMMMLVVGIVLACGANALAVDMEWVTVGDPCNVADTEIMTTDATTGYGSVSYVYRIGKYEVTAGQYKDFLNAVAATDTYGLYNTNMWSSGHGCKIERGGSPGSYTYLVVDPNRLDRPVNYVVWYDSLRFANWLHNGQPTGLQDDSTTEDGAYDMDGDPNLPRKANAKVWLPSENEWYKAAYHKNDGVTGNYFDYPTSSDSVPGRDMSEATNAGNNANYYDSGYLIGPPYYRTEVGEFELSDSPYGTFDMGGNVWEWNETLIGSDRGFRGGSYDSFGDVSYLRSSTRCSYDPYTVDNNIGFRVASGTVLVSPNGGETFIAGTNQTIEWLSPAPADANMLLEYSVNDGLSWVTIDANTENDGQYDWLVPEVTSNQCLVRVAEVNNANIYDTSDDVFTIFRCLHPIGDLNKDCFVDYLDFILMAANWLKSGNIDDGLVAYWSFDEGSGTTAQDVIGDNDGNLVGDTNWVNGISGKALDFDGSGDYVGVDSNSNLSFNSPSDPFSTSFWIKPDSIIPITQTILENEDDYIVLLYEGGVLSYRKTDSGNLYHNSWFSTNPEILAENWSHIAITYDGTGSGGTKMYVNGEEKPVTNTTYHGGGSASGNNFAIGIRAYDLATETYEGKIDEVRIYNRALTSAEIEYLYQNP